MRFTFPPKRKERSRMIKIGFVDYYIDEWHAHNFAKRYKELSAEIGIECDIVGVFAVVEKPSDEKLSTAQWCENYGIRHYESITELANDCDAFVIFAPDDPEIHPALCRLTFPFGKPTFVDKTFALSVRAAKNMLAQAEKNGARMYTTSSLRYATEVQSSIGKKEAAVKGNYVHMKDYLVHTGEMVVTALGVGMSTLSCTVDDEKYSFDIGYVDDRHATVIMTPEYGFEINGTAVESDFFGGQIKDIISFFAGKEAPVSVDEMLEVARFVEGGLLAIESPKKTIDLSIL